jgi:predicted amidohydrolase YtcJ
MYYEVEQIDSLQRKGKLKMRLYVMLSDNPTNFEKYLHKPPYKTEHLYVKGIKAYADGALGSRGACLLHPYSDEPNWQGFLLSNISHFDSLAAMLAPTDYQLCTHAIGDSGNRMVLNIYKKYLKEKNNKRWRIEHAQVVSPDDIPTFGAYSIIPSVQPTHATSDMNWAEARLGKDRIHTAYAYKALLQQNGWIPLGTDFPVEDIVPFKTLKAAVARTNGQNEPKGGYQLEQGLTILEAIKGVTIWAAKANSIN